MIGGRPVWWCNFHDRVWVGGDGLGDVELSDHPLVYLLWFGEGFEPSLGEVTPV